MLLRRDDGFEIDTDPSRLEPGRVHEWLSTDAYWALGRSATAVATSIANSICYGVYAPTGRQVGIARAVTDRATYAWICDVYVEPGSRGRGLGTWLAGGIVADLLDLGVPRIVLATADAHEVYRRAGFDDLADPSRFMEIDRRSVGVPERDVADS
ncbi:MAG TPA: GNAT family N-acetyltransferase [Micromonosporaceae bacterium]|jgi:predicted GNAT family acetyltransferase